jgi:hypothetical protein
MRREPVIPAIKRERCPACGRAIPYWTRKRIIEAIQRWEREYGAPPKATNWQPRATPWHPTIGMVRLVFGNWNAALTAAGFDVRHRRWSREEIKQAIYQWVYEHGELPTCNEWRVAAPGRPSEGSVRRTFGSWNAGIREAGYEPRASREALALPGDVIARLVVRERRLP